MFITRLISGAILVALIIALGITGGYYLWAFTLLISLIGMFELYRVFKIEKSLLLVFPFIAIILYYVNLMFNIIPDSMMIFLGCLVLNMFVFVFAFPKYRAKQVMASFFGIFYVGIMLSYIYQIRTMDMGKYLVFLIFLSAWGCDTMAYCTGKLTHMIVGKNHQMSPKLSPKKSIEGAVGGVIGAALFTAIYCAILKNQMGLETYQIAILSAIAAVAGLVSMVGDLCASAIKRNYDIKDYGKLIPGHGGILDRFDSMIIIAPIIFYLAKYLIVGA